MVNSRSLCLGTANHRAWRHYVFRCLSIPFSWKWYLILKKTLNLADASTWTQQWIDSILGHCNYLSDPFCYCSISAPGGAFIIPGISPHGPMYELIRTWVLTDVHVKCNVTGQHTTARLCPLIWLLHYAQSAEHDTSRLQLHSKEEMTTIFGGWLIILFC